MDKQKYAVSSSYNTTVRWDKMWDYTFEKRSELWLLIKRVFIKKESSKYKICFLEVWSLMGATGYNCVVIHHTCVWIYYGLRIHIAKFTISQLQKEKKA